MLRVVYRSPAKAPVTSSRVLLAGSSSVSVVFSSRPQVGELPLNQPMLKCRRAVASSCISVKLAE